VYDNFLKCLALFNQDIISRNELITLVEPFLGKFANLYRWFKDYVDNKPMNNAYFENESAERRMISRDRLNVPNGDHIPMEID
jgi:paired amphipathic helix protein Sin3a